MCLKNKTFRNRSGSFALLLCRISRLASKSPSKLPFQLFCRNFLKEKSLLNLKMAELEGHLSGGENQGMLIGLKSAHFGTKSGAH
jgi:hypothetical protein